VLDAALIPWGSGRPPSPPTLAIGPALSKTLMRRPGSGIWAICGGGNDGALIFQFSASESAAITLAEKPFISHVRRLDHVPGGRVLSLRCRSRLPLGCPVPINKHSLSHPGSPQLGQGYSMT
jgi:hypothetical protein